MYDFTTLRPRRGIGASKWQPLERAGVADPDVIPFSIADMDLITAPEIISALRAAPERTWRCAGALRMQTACICRAVTAC